MADNHSITIEADVSIEASIIERIIIVYAGDLIVARVIYDDALEKIITAHGEWYEKYGDRKVDPVGLLIAEKCPRQLDDGFICTPYGRLPITWQESSSWEIPLPATKFVTQIAGSVPEKKLEAVCHKYDAEYDRVLISQFEEGWVVRRDEIYPSRDFIDALRALEAEYGGGP